MKNIQFPLIASPAPTGLDSFRSGFAFRGYYVEYNEERLNGISNYKQMLVGVSCIYAVISS